jgi:hypothetical protein
MLHPEEPDLEDFFAGMPPWLKEVCVLWDGREPDFEPRCPAPVRRACRPLAAHFGEQRNAMLALCRTEWCLYLDADERLSPAAWERLPRILSKSPGPAGVLFPRWTFEGDAGHVRMGYGLWPDVQLRLFRRAPGLRFEGAVHERLSGVSGCIALAPDAALLHYSHVRKDSRTLEQRLEMFNRAAGKEMHRLSEGYPRLPAAFFREIGGAFADRLLILPASAGQKPSPGRGRTPLRGLRKGTPLSRR